MILYCEKIGGLSPNDTLCNCQGCRANNEIIRSAGRIKQLEAALREISDDIERFGRVNHLYEKSAEIVARAITALEQSSPPSATS